LIEGVSGGSNQILPHIQNISSSMPSVSTRALIQPVLLAPIAISGDNIFIVWPDNRTATASPDPNSEEDNLQASKNTDHVNWDIFFVRSSDRGQTFSEPINLSNSTNGTSIGAEVTVHDRDPNNVSVYVTFWDNKTGENNPYFVSSNDGGIRFSKPIMLNVTTMH
jgi:hypothetical protein